MLQYEKLKSLFRHKKLQVGFGVAIILLLALVKAYFVCKGRIDIEVDGDESARAADGVFRSADSLPKLFSDFFSWLKILDIHPPGDWFLKAVWLKFWSWLVGSGLDYLVALKLLAILSFTAATLTVFLYGYWLGGFFVGFVGIFLMSASHMLFYTGVSSRAENLALTLILAANLALAYPFLKPKAVSRADETFPRKWIYLSGALYFVASFFRSEVVLLLPGICLFLLFYRGFRDTFLFGLIAASYTVFKLVISKLFFPSAVQYTGAHSVWNYVKLGTLGFFTSDLVQRYFLRDLWIVLPVLTGFSLIAAGLYFYKKNRAELELFWLSAAPFLSLAPILSFLLMVGIAPGFPRVTTFPVALTIPIQLFLLSRLKLLKDFKIRGLAGLALAVALVPITTVRLRDAAGSVTADRKEAAAWLKANYKVGDGALIDYQQFWEWYFIAKLAQPGRGDELCNYGSCEVHELGDKYHLFKLDPAADEFNHFRAHLFVEEFHPKWFILPGPDTYARWREGRWVADNLSSFIYSHLCVGEKEPGPQTTIVMKLLQNDKPIALEKVFGNGQVEIWKYRPELSSCALSVTNVGRSD